MKKINLRKCYNNLFETKGLNEKCQGVRKDLQIKEENVSSKKYGLYSTSSPKEKNVLFEHFKIKNTFRASVLMYSI